MRAEPRLKLYPVRHACKVLGVSYPALKQWIYKGKIKTVKTPGGHHRIPESRDRPPAACRSPARHGAKTPGVFQDHQRTQPVDGPRG